jgi:hypothetical protein
VTAHWGLPDPAAVEGSDDQKRRAFLDALLVLKRRISLLANLPVDTLDAMTLRERVGQIGRE